MPRRHHQLLHRAVADSSSQRSASFASSFAASFRASCSTRSSGTRGYEAPAQRLDARKAVDVITSSFVRAAPARASAAAAPPTSVAARRPPRDRNHADSAASRDVEARREHNSAADRQPVDRADRHWSSDSSGHVRCPARRAPACRYRASAALRALQVRSDENARPAPVRITTRVSIRPAARGRRAASPVHRHVDRVHLSGRFSVMSPGLQARRRARRATSPWW